MPRKLGKQAVRTCPNCRESVDRVAEFEDGSARAEPCGCEFDDVDKLVDKETLI